MAADSRQLAARRGKKGQGARSGISDVARLEIHTQAALQNSSSNGT
jgi:hypothetical protein